MRIIVVGDERTALVEMNLDKYYHQSICVCFVFFGATFTLQITTISHAII